MENNILRGKSLLYEPSVKDWAVLAHNNWGMNAIEWLEGSGFIRDYRSSRAVAGLVVLADLGDIESIDYLVRVFPNHIIVVNSLAGDDDAFRGSSEDMNEIVKMAAGIMDNRMNSNPDWILDYYHTLIRAVSA